MQNMRPDRSSSDRDAAVHDVVINPWPDSCVLEIGRKQLQTLAMAVDPLGRL